MNKSIAHALTLAVLLACGCSVESCTTQSASSAHSSSGMASKSAAAPKELVPPPVAAPGTSLGTARPSSTNFPGTQYPRIEPDGRVSFRFVAPAAQKVRVSIVNTPFDMVKGDDGAWTYTTAQPQAPGYHNYWMLVDDAITLDPNTYAYIGYGHSCNGFEVPEPGVSWYDVKDVPHGDVLIKNYWAKSTNQWRQIYIYTPPGYSNDPKTRYPVLLLQHGSGEDQRVWIEMGHTNVILDNLIAEGKAKPMIVVMESSALPGAGGGGRGGAGRGGAGAPGAGGARGAGGPPAAGGPPGAGAGRGAGGPPGAGAPAAAGRGAGGPPGAAAAGGPGAGGGRGAGGGGREAGGGARGGLGGPLGGGAYGDLLTSELIPWVDKNFRTIPDQQHRAMAGLSLGAAQTKSITLGHLDLFSHIGMFSGGTIAPAEITDKSKVNLVFMSYGGVENGAATVKAAADTLTQAGIPGYAYVSPGTAHEWQSWRRSLYAFAPLLFRN